MGYAKYIFVSEVVEKSEMVGFDQATASYSHGINFLEPSI